MNGNSKKLQSVILAMFIAMSACLEQDKSEPPPEKQNIFDIEKAVCHSIDILLLYIILVRKIFGLSEFAFLCSFLNAYCNSNRSTYHRVVAHADKSHHLNVCRNRA